MEEIKNRTNSQNSSTGMNRKTEANLQGTEGLGGGRIPTRPNYGEKYKVGGLPQKEDCYTDIPFQTKWKECQRMQGLKERKPSSLEDALGKKKDLGGLFHAKRSGKISTRLLQKSSRGEGGKGGK